MENENTKKQSYWDKLLTEQVAKILLGSGLIVILIGLTIFAIHENYSLSNTIKSDKVGQLGDFIGGVVGSIWGLAGVILFYVALIKQKEALEDQKTATRQTHEAVRLQTEELKLQREELEFSRKEFTLSRITSIIYNQLFKIEAAIDDFSITWVEKNVQEYKGIIGLNFIESKFEFLYKQIELKELPTKTDTKRIIENVIVNYHNNQQVLFLLFQKLFNSFAAIDTQIEFSGLSGSEKNDLRIHFQGNIGATVINVLRTPLLLRHYLKKIYNENLPEKIELNKDCFLNLVTFSEFIEKFLNKSVEKT